MDALVQLRIVQSHREQDYKEVLEVMRLHKTWKKG